ncbi:hypothetical protein AAVH_29433 [Aphelenchoides avenae]|nr:hypothetical protein AAVH_29433 [Aphelenchus avenae]
MESDRLMWLSDHQNEIRAAQYSVQNQARQIAEEMNVDYEAVKVLPASHPGSPRYMQKQYQNAMAIVRRYGRPDIFLTITCNPSWREIKENCELHFADGHTVKLTAGDRPTILSRVFHLKKKALLDEIKNGLFGVPVAHGHVIEYQKRGLPHAHFLITLADGHKLNTVERVDAIMSAQIPDRVADPELYDLVKKDMIHGIAYVKLKRPDNGRVVDFGGGRIADNRFVVPYCPYLLRRYNAHINCEVVAGLKAVKYLYKYIYTGLDRADVEIAT